MKRIKKKATAWLVATVGFILALIAYGLYKAVVVIYGPPPVNKPCIYSPPPSEELYEQTNVQPTDKGVSVSLDSIQSRHTIE